MTQEQIDQMFNSLMQAHVEINHAIGLMDEIIKRDPDNPLHEALGWALEYTDKAKSMVKERIGVQ